MNGSHRLLSTKKQQFRDKDIIFREGDPATRAFTIIAGKVELVTDVDGKEKHLDLLGPGKTLGEKDVSRGRHQATAIAAGTVTLRPLDQQAMAMVKRRGSLLKDRLKATWSLISFLERTARSLRLAVGMTQPAGMHINKLSKE